MIDTSNEVVRWLADQSMHDAAMAEVSASAVTDIEQKDKLRSDSASHRQRAATLLALMAERNEIESVITVWRGHTQRAEAERDRLRDEVTRLEASLHQWVEDCATHLKTIAALEDRA